MVANKCLRLVNYKMLEYASLILYRDSNIIAAIVAYSFHTTGLIGFYCIGFAMFAGKLAVSVC
jgi:hypothetical protein